VCPAACREPVRLNASQQELVRRYLGLARRLAARYAALVPRFRDEIESAAMLGLCHAAIRFCERRRYRFSTYAICRIRGEIRSALRATELKGYRRRRRALAPQLVSQPCQLDAPWHPTDPAGPVGWELESLDEVERLARSLPHPYAVAVRLYYGHAGVTMRQIACQLGVSDCRVSQILSQALTWLRHGLFA
jgi:RNA polymerase sigma factor (sigma-70 family)